MTVFKGIISVIGCSLVFFGSSTAQSPVKVKEISVHIDSVYTTIMFYGPQMVRVVKRDAEQPAGKNMPGTQHLYILKKTVPTAVVNTYSDKEYIYKTDSLEIHVNKENGAITFQRAAEILLKEDPAIGPHFSELSDKPGFYRIRQGFILDNNEPIYGLGQHQKGTMEQNNQQLLLQQSNMEIAIPIFQSLKGYGVVWNNESATLFSDTLSRTSFLSDKGTAVDYFFIAGRNTDQVVASLRLLTGRAPMPPLWAFGYFQSRERYESRQQLLNVVKTYRNLKVPLDGIVQDWRYWGMSVDNWNSTEFGNPAFSKPQAMIDSVHLLNAHLVLSVWPSFGKNTKVYKDLDAHSGLLKGLKTWPPDGGVTIYNAFDKKARDIVWSYMNRNLYFKGVDGWWLDATEPIDKVTQPYIDILERSDDSMRTVPNSYPLYTTSGIADHAKTVEKEKRVFILTRSAFTGQQHYGTFIWSGDIVSSWEVMKNQISGALNVGLCGIPYWNTDIGGFFSGNLYPKGVKDPAFRELYVRWLEMATFFPLMRSHGTNTPREIYQFGKKGDWAYDAIDKYIRLRYQLLPYNYSTAYQVWKNGASFMRPLFSDFSADTMTYAISDQYLYGRSFLVAPVTSSQYTGLPGKMLPADFSSVKSRKLYLPLGTDWYDFWTGKRFKGGCWVDKKTPVDMLPVFVKAGTILPLARVRQYTGEDKDSTLEIRVYPSASGRFTLYEDQGDNYNYEKGSYSTIDFNWDDEQGLLKIGARKGWFPGMLRDRQFRVVVVGRGVEKTLRYIGSSLTLSF